MNYIQINKNNSYKNEYSVKSFEISHVFIENTYDFIISNNKFKIVRIIFVFLNIIFILISNINNKFINNFYKIKLKKEIMNLENYYKICNEGILLNNTKQFKKHENPIISIISSVYNQQKYILRFLRSIQNQNFEQIEIILIDDFSVDNTVNIIENFQKDDKRIIIIKNKNNKGTLISRNEGILISKGKYLIISDGDDILSDNLLNKCFLIAEKYNYDMIRFNTYLGNRNIFLYDKIKYLVNKDIYQPQLSSYIFYSGGNLEITDPMISNKFIKRNIFIKSINLINDFF